MNSFVWLLATMALAKSAPTRVFKSPKSACEVRQSGGANEGDYPRYQIYRKDRLLFPLEYDGSLSVLFSPSGKYLAFGNSEMDSFEKKGSILVLNCEAGWKKTYVPASCSKKVREGACLIDYAKPQAWSADEKSLRYVRHGSGQDTTETLVFDQWNPLP